MKHFTIFKSWLAMLLLMIGVSASWAESYTVTFGNSVKSATAISATTKASTVVASGAEYLTAQPFAVKGNAYYGDNQQSIRLCKSGIASELTISLSNSGKVKATSIVVNAARYSAGKEVQLSVNGAESQDIAEAAADYTFACDGTQLSNIVLSASQYMFVYSITVNYTESSTPTDPDPETPTDPEVKTYASLADLVAAGAPTTDGENVKVTLSNEVIKSIYVTKSGYRNGIFLEAGGKEIEIFSHDVPEAWVVGGKVSGTLTCPWKLYNTTWELCPDDWSDLTYTAPEGGDTPDTPTGDVIPNFIKTSTLTLTVGDEPYDVRSCLNIPSDAGYDQFSITTSINGETAKKDEFACVYSKISFQKAGTYVVTVKAPAVEGKYAETTGTITVTVNGASVAEPVEMAIADFIAAGGSTEGVYLIGTVSNIKSTTYGNFDLTDESGTIYIYGCLTPEGQERQFASLGVVEGDKIKVLAKEYKLFNETKEAVNVVFVEKISGSTVVTYDINIAETENGTVKAPASAAAGVEVSVTVSPASGYKLDVLTVTDAKGNAVELDGYKFTMPESAVTVSATFKAVDIIDFGEHSFVPNQVELTKDDAAFSLTGSANGYTVVAKKGEGSTSTPVYNATAQDMRVYAKGTLTITSDEPFNEVVFAISEQGLKRQAPITADCGEVAAQTAGDNTVTWTSEEGVTSVTFTVGDKAEYGSEGATKAGQLCFNYIDITPAAPATSGTLQLVAHNEDGYWATFSAKKGVFFKSADATVYTLTVDGEKVVATELSDDSYVTTAAGYGYYVPAGTGVLVKSSSTSVTYYMSAGSDLDELLPVTADNLLRPATAQMTGDCKFYRLAYDNYTTKTGLGFYYGAANGAAFTCKAGGAYLAVPAAVASVKGFTLGSLEDAIKSVEMAEQSGAIYDLQGRRVEKALKGLYIVNGKKVVR